LMAARSNPDMRAALQAGLPYQTLDWNRILRLGNRYFDALLKDRTALSPQQREVELKALAQWSAQFDQTAGSANVLTEDHPPKWLFPKPGENRDAYSDRVGAVLLEMHLPSINRMAEQATLVDDRLDWIAHVGVALAVYRQDHGNYPANLEALIPKYLASLPASMSERPVVYERREGGYVIRRAREYSAWMKQRLAEDHRDFEPGDVLIRTDQWQ
jgi:hypothetical protein